MLRHISTRKSSVPQGIRWSNIASLLSHIAQECDDTSVYLRIPTFAEFGIDSFKFWRIFLKKENFILHFFFWITKVQTSKITSHAIKIYLWRLLFDITVSKSFACRLFLRSFFFEKKSFLSFLPVLKCLHLCSSSSVCTWQHSKKRSASNS